MPSCSLLIILAHQRVTLISEKNVINTKKVKKINKKPNPRPGLLIQKCHLLSSVTLQTLHTFSRIKMTDHRKNGHDWEKSQVSTSNQLD